MPPMSYDLAIVGGGINGVAIARDAAGRGLKVILCEQDDLAAHTSSASTKLIHGGLRYLEHFQFRLVREALREREILLHVAPHLVHPIRLVLPHNPSLRPAWLVQFGLLFYDRLDKKRQLPPSAKIDLREHLTGAELKADYRKAFVFSDCQTNDARLVIANALDAKARGAEILTRTRCLRARREGDHWRLELAPASSVLRREINARILVNATGPWGTHFLDQVIRQTHSHRLRLVKGSHIVVRRSFVHDFGYLFQTEDRRVVFALPYAQDFTLIGTTEVDYQGDLSRPEVDDSEVEYLCKIVNNYCNHPISSADVVYKFAGIRPLLQQAGDSITAMSREYRLELESFEGRTPLLSVFGGKLTTYRKLAERALDKILPLLKVQAPAWTADAILPGGDLNELSVEEYQRQLRAQYTWIPPHLAARYCRTYGSLAKNFLQPTHSLTAMGEEIVPHVYAAELHYLREHEWAVTLEDILWRRTQLGLSLDSAQKEILQIWLDKHE